MPDDWEPFPTPEMREEWRKQVLNALAIPAELLLEKGMITTERIIDGKLYSLVCRPVDK